MDCFSIIVKDSYPSFSEKYLEQLKKFTLPNIRNCIYNNEELLCHEVNGQDGGRKTSGSDFFKILAAGVAQYITGELSREIMKEILQEYFFYLRNGEQQEILELVNQESRCHDFKKVEERLLTFFKEGRSHLDMEGFLRFRLGDYVKNLYRLIDLRVSKLINQKELPEYIILLKDILKFQEPRVEVLHLDVDYMGHLRISSVFPFPQGDPRVVTWERFSDSRHYEDTIVHALVWLAPCKLVLHRQVFLSYPQVSTVLSEIFENRISGCSNCRLCHLRERDTVGD